MPKVVQTIIDANVIILQNSQNDNTSDKNSSKKVDSGGRAALADGTKATSSHKGEILGGAVEALTKFACFVIDKP